MNNALHLVCLARLVRQSFSDPGCLVRLESSLATDQNFVHKGFVWYSSFVCPKGCEADGQDH
jgi:hypothetical protein